MKALVSVETIEKKILLICGEKVMLDSDLADLYGVPVKGLNQAVKCNMGRFPADFMFQLSKEEDDSLRSQTVTLKKGRGAHRKYLPYDFSDENARPEAYKWLRENLEKLNKVFTPRIKRL